MGVITSVDAIFIRQENPRDRTFVESHLCAQNGKDQAPSQCAIHIT